jgi:hypothetical protein
MYGIGLFRPTSTQIGTTVGVCGTDVTKHNTFWMFTIASLLIFAMRDGITSPKKLNIEDKRGV